MSSTELQSQVWIPCPDCAPFHIRGPADALTLATAWPELPRVRADAGAARRRPAHHADGHEPGGRARLRPRAHRATRHPAARCVASRCSPRCGARTSTGSSSWSLFADPEAPLPRTTGIRLVDWVQIDFDDDSSARCARVGRSPAQHGPPPPGGSVCMTPPLANRSSSGGRAASILGMTRRLKSARASMSADMEQVDVLVVGAGIVGLATARAIQQAQPGARGRGRGQGGRARAGTSPAATRA